MDTRSFIVELVRALAWPITTLVILLVLRKQLTDLLRSLRRFKYGDAEAEFAEGLQVLMEAAPQVHLPTAPMARHEFPVPIVKPDLAILDAWRSVEGAVLELGGSAKVPGRTALETLRQLRDKGVITEKDYDAVNGLRALRNLVAHREEPSVSPQKAAEYLAMAEAVAMVLEQKARKA